MKATKEVEEMSIWPKIAFAFVAGLCLAGAGALLVVKNMTPKTPQPLREAAGPVAPPSSIATPAPQPTPVPDLTTQSDKPADPPVAPAEKETRASVHKGHPSAFGDRPPKQAVTMASTMPPLPAQRQVTPSASQNDAPEQAAQQNRPQYAPLPDVPPVPPQNVPPVERAAQPDTRQDSTPASPARQPQTVTIEAGTSLMVRLGETISTKTKVAGDSFRGTLDQPIIMNGFVIADRGSRVVGRVVSAQKGGHLSGSSDLSLQVTEINTTDGQTVRVQTSPWEKKGDSNTAGNVEKIGGGAALGAIIGAIAGGGKGAAIGAAGGGAAGTGVAAATGGKPTVVPVETRIAFRLDAPVTITEQINN
jgi:hypothetical protein